jgi:hypothetical protein
MSTETNKTLEKDPEIKNAASTPQPPSEEDYIQLRKEAVEHLKEEIKFLEVEEEYEKLQANIEEHKTRRYVMIARQAELFQKNNPENEVDNTPEEPMPRRPLKTN